MNNTLLLLIIGGALALVVVIRILAGTDSVVGKICRWWWNIGFRLWSHVPFMGWMAHLIVAKTPKEQAMKARTLGSSAATNQMAYDAIEAAAQRQREEEARNEKIRREMAYRGLDNVSINSDGTSATGTDKYGNTHNVNINWD